MGITALLFALTGTTEAAKGWSLVDLGERDALCYEAPHFSHGLEAYGTSHDASGKPTKYRLEPELTNAKRAFAEEGTRYCFFFPSGAPDGIYDVQGIFADGKETLVGKVIRNWSGLEFLHNPYPPSFVASIHPLPTSGGYDVPQSYFIFSDDAAPGVKAYAITPENTTVELPRAERTINRMDLEKGRVACDDNKEYACFFLPPELAKTRIRFYAVDEDGNSSERYVSQPELSGSHLHYNIDKDKTETKQ